MKQLYTIRESGGSYDDAWETVKFVTDDHEKAQVYCAKMNAFRDVIAAAKKQSNEYQRNWQVVNPRPVCQDPVLVKIPKWDNYTPPTKEMREERKRLEEINQLAKVEAYQPMNEWFQASYEAVVDFNATFSEEIQKGIKENLDDCYWDVESVDWLD